ncbi:hypothetical protein, partial [Verrucosispora sioxanthis]|uniref:hypothetical protein n=1 Tax=Verrucosispora sioxanthis TaxID=2499994 RepID=UPI001C119F8D
MSVTTCLTSVAVASQASASGSGAKWTVRRSWSSSKASRASGSDSRDSSPAIRVPGAVGVGHGSQQGRGESPGGVGAVHGSVDPADPDVLVVALTVPDRNSIAGAEVQGGGVRLGQADLYRPGRSVVGDLGGPPGCGGAGCVAGDPGHVRAAEVIGQVGDLEGTRSVAVGDGEARAGDNGDGRQQRRVQVGPERVRRPGAEVVDVLGEAGHPDPPAGGTVVACPVGVDED